MAKRKKSHMNWEKRKDFPSKRTVFLNLFAFLAWNIRIASFFLLFLLELVNLLSYLIDKYGRRTISRFVCPRAKFYGTSMHVTHMVSLPSNICHVMNWSLFILDDQDGNKCGSQMIVFSFYFSIYFCFFLFLSIFLYFFLFVCLSFYFFLCLSVFLFFGW